VKIFIGVLGLALLLVVLWDGFEAIILPRRVTRRIRLTRMFYKTTWVVWSAAGRRMRKNRRRDTYLSVFGPLSMLFLLTLWAIGLIVSFAMLQWAFGSALHTPDREVTFLTDLYMSGTTFFTLGLGDVTPYTPIARLITVAEAGTGFGFLAIVIGYLPILYQGFSKREVSISLLDARAGSPPSAAELLRRHSQANAMGSLTDLLRHWEIWSAELLESHISYPVLAYFRSQHANESWLAALAVVLDACALLIAATDGAAGWQAHLTFAMSRHAVVDLAQIFDASPRASGHDRLPPPKLAKLQELTPLCKGEQVSSRLDELRRMYEPYINALAHYFFLAVPSFLPVGNHPDNWQTSAWERSSARTVFPVLDSAEDDHLD
jgi:hypothetical protein